MLSFTFISLQKTKFKKEKKNQKMGNVLLLVLDWALGSSDFPAKIGKALKKMVAKNDNFRVHRPMLAFLHFEFGYLR